MKKKTNFFSFLRNSRIFHSRLPASRRFGIERGTPIDRYYIEKFLSQHQHLIKGVVLEVGNSLYTRQFGKDAVTHSLVLHVSPEKKNADIVGNLETGEGIPENRADCFIMTQTLPCIFDVRRAAASAVRILKSGGVLLLTVPGITQISRHDYERWGQYWSFTDQSVRRLFEEVVPPEHIEITMYGNVKAAAGFLYGLSAGDLSRDDLEFDDNDYQLLIAAAIRK